jgi:nucleoside-diphosphate-sugar epimerase
MARPDRGAVAADAREPSRDNGCVRVLVLGGTGFIGPYVVRLLAGRGHEVTVFHRGRTERELPASVRHLHHAFAAIPDLVGSWGEQPDVVLDMVPFIDKGGHGIRHFGGSAGRAVAITSCDVYRAFARLWRSEPGPPDPTPLTEDSPLRSKPAGDLDESIDYDNIDVERVFASDAGLPVTILRLPATHGPGDPQHRLHRYVKRMDDGRPAILVEERFAAWRWVRGYVENVAAAIALAVEDDNAAGRVYNVAETVAYCEADWIRRIGDAVGWAGEIVVLPRDRLPEHLRSSRDFDFDQDYLVDSTRIRSELGYSELVDEDEALQRTIDWERNNPLETEPERFDYDAEDKALSDLSR